MQQLFQLHHTGIKTSVQEAASTIQISFQLHHTGIKTTFSGALIGIDYTYFNCTIQELKLRSS